MLPNNNVASAMAGGPNSIRPTAFYQIADLIQAKVLDAEGRMVAPALLNLLETYISESDREIENLGRTVSALAAEIRNSSRRQNPFTTEQTAQDPLAELRNASGSTFVRVIYDVLRGVHQGFHEIRRMLDMVQPAPLMLAGDRPDMTRYDWMRDADQLTRISFEMQANGPAVTKFVEGVLSLDNLKTSIIDLAYGISKVFDEYYARLLQRHTVDGIEIHESPVITDIALSIYSNVDSHGEIAGGKSPEEISAFSIRKAKLLIDFIQTGTVAEVIADPEQLVDSVKKQLNALWDLATAIELSISEVAAEVREVLGRRKSTSHFSTATEFNNALTFLDDLNPRNISYKEKEGLLTADERFEKEFTNETLRNLSTMLVRQRSAQEVVDYILQRKAKLRDYHDPAHARLILDAVLGEEPRLELNGLLRDRDVRAVRPEDTDLAPVNGYPTPGAQRLFEVGRLVLGGVPVCTIRPPLVAVPAQLAWRVLRPQRMPRVVVSGLAVTPRAQNDRVLERVRAPVGLLDDVMHVDVPPSRLVAHAAVAP